MWHSSGCSNVNRCESRSKTNSNDSNTPRRRRTYCISYNRINLTCQWLTYVHSWRIYVISSNHFGYSPLTSLKIKYLKWWKCESIFVLSNFFFYHFLIGLFTFVFWLFCSWSIRCGSGTLLKRPLYSTLAFVGGSSCSPLNITEGLAARPPSGLIDARWWWLARWASTTEGLPMIDPRAITEPRPCVWRTEWRYLRYSSKVIPSGSWSRRYFLRLDLIRS